MTSTRHLVSTLRGEIAKARQKRDTDTWFTEQRGRVLATLRNAMNVPETAVGLLVQVWPVVPAHVDEDAVHWLSDIGSELATVLPTSLRLAVAFRRAAQSLRVHGRLRLAAVHGIRELAIHRHRDDDPDATAAALHDLAATYSAQERWHKVVGCADEILETYLLHDDQVGIIYALDHLGSLMIQIGRHRAAARYLARADKAFERTPDCAGHAECLARLGLALSVLDDGAGARLAINRALALVADSNDSTAHTVREIVGRADSAEFRLEGD
ncbi:hypothetical protein B0I31_10919 [Saccharothrix carnea]|uniref:Tetratricopeptide repeat protein n=1 Tax=Saccharothrix carnea TaxID=1280637 RepID=A0A2P8I445_SACCR|nr:hypothetical protein [Saccharothrix carnea]PSL53229.1 hypothetical protein B0I31_10919 [Saccharothrix carnea]